MQPSNNYLIFFRFFSRVTSLHNGIYDKPSAPIANPIVAFKLVKRLKSEWMNVVHSNEAEENINGSLLTFTNIHIFRKALIHSFKTVTVASYAFHCSLACLSHSILPLSQPPFTVFVKPLGRATGEWKAAYPSWKTFMEQRRV